MKSVNILVASQLRTHTQQTSKRDKTAYSLLASSNLSSINHDCLLLGTINESSTNKNKYTTLNNNTPQEHDASATDITVTVCVTAVIEFTSSKSYIPFLSNKAEVPREEISSQNGCLTILGMLRGNYPTNHSDESNIRHNFTIDPDIIRHQSRHCRQNMRHIHSKCSKLQRVLIDSLSCNSEYFLYIDASREFYEISDEKNSGTFCLHANDCLEEYIFFTDRMTQCLDGNQVTVIRHDPDELLQSHLLRGIISRKINLQTGLADLEWCKDDYRTNMQYYLNSPFFVPILFESLENTYCALKNSLKQNQLLLTFSQSRDFTIEKAICYVYDPTLSVPSTSVDSTHMMPLPLFNLDLVALSNGHERTVMKNYCSGRKRLAQTLQNSSVVSQQELKRAEANNQKRFLSRTMSTPNDIDTDPKYHYATNLHLRVEEKKSFSPLNWLTQMRDLSIRKTCTGRQIHTRCVQLRHCYKTLITSLHETPPDRWDHASTCSRYSDDNSSQDITPEHAVSSLNVLVSVGLDILIGLTLTLLLMLYIGPSNWFDMSMNHAFRVVDQVQKLLNSLMRMPVGLKLNPPLNQAMGKFFLYHIYLWKTFVTLIRPLLAIAIHALTLTGIFGISCLLSVGCDLFSIITIHIYCFYGYASRFYNLQIRGLIALWRLFRGKKWNLLRHRVDSHSYGTDQLFVGTISFTIIFFLVPTVFTYYLVFFTLHLVTKVLQDTLKYIYHLMTCLPIYTIILWLSKSKKVASQVSMVPTMFSGDDNRIARSLTGRQTFVYLRTCTESLRTTLLMNSQLNSYQRSKHCKKIGHHEQTCQAACDIN